MSKPEPLEDSTRTGGQAEAPKALGPGPLRLDQESRELARAEAGSNLLACYQCGKCSAGCPVAEFTDLLPHRIIRLAQLGQRREILASAHIWTCTGCGTCSTRCPNLVDVAGLMDRLKAQSVRSASNPGAAKAAQFHELFNQSVQRFGRSHELGVLRRLKTTGEMIKDMGLGWKMMRKGKIRIRAQKVQARDEIREIFRRAAEADK